MFTSLTAFKGLIRTKGLGKCYESSAIQAVSDIDLQIEQGEFIALMGDCNGGKSTLLKVISLSITHSEGKLFFMDQDVSKLTNSQREQFRYDHIGLIKPIRKGLRIPRFPRLPKGAAIGSADVRILFGPDSVKQMLQALPGLNRSIIVADEPTVYLEPDPAKKVMECLAKLNEAGTTVIFATHSDESASYANRIIKMADGQIVSDSSA